MNIKSLAILESNIKRDNFRAILSGPTPPNPMELISGETTKEFFRQLKERYGYVFADTPPIGMVADALILLKLLF